MFKYKTSDGIEFTCSEPIIGGQETIDRLGKFLANATDKTADSESQEKSISDLIYADFNKKKEWK